MHIRSLRMIHIYIYIYVKSMLTFQKCAIGMYVCIQVVLIAHVTICIHLVTHILVSYFEWSPGSRVSAEGCNNTESKTITLKTYWFKTFCTTADPTWIRVLVRPCEHFAKQGRSIAFWLKLINIVSECHQHWHRNPTNILTPSWVNI